MAVICHTLSVPAVLGQLSPNDPDVKNLIAILCLYWEVMRPLKVEPCSMVGGS